ncbi:hypothetical protein DICSQDRAFT_128036 [Dichomitus squalens LYAD-421 SS1]|uniref:Uncharacterized protein n=1 Tax=Dichomitus squalens (strain LYAD-421) TaxID=732165 RepID=R7SVH0_DICSQ|nr:uncharacterized protein DICSQDRAFT_128036 [Dichomitus squalens LYAD-421 SS1]EJF59923.1 hypothetical protein DICSQDRAFT_128036 [Dichomitus squalens LYAD-421 SS1]
MSHLDIASGCRRSLSITVNYCTSPAGNKNLARELFIFQCDLKSLVPISDIKTQKVLLGALKKEVEGRERAQEVARKCVLREIEERQLGLAATSVVSTFSSKAQSAEVRETRRKSDFDPRLRRPPSSRSSASNSRL